MKKLIYRLSVKAVLLIISAVAVEFILYTVGGELSATTATGQMAIGGSALPLRVFHFLSNSYWIIFLVAAILLLLKDGIRLIKLLRQKNNEEKGEKTNENM